MGCPTILLLLHTTRDKNSSGASTDVIWLPYDQILAMYINCRYLIYLNNSINNSILRSDRRVKKEGVGNRILKER